jgi:histidyl-tRNA synthetase
MESGAIDLSRFESPVQVSVLCMGGENLAYAVSVLNALRDANIASVAYLDAEKKFKNQIEYADKIKTEYSAIIGEDEVKNELVALKNMTTGEQQAVSVEDMIKIIKAN